MAACGSAGAKSTGSSTSGQGGSPVINGGAGSYAGNGTAGNAYVVSTGGAPTTVVDGGRPPRCDDAGHCTCINIAEFGKTGSFGAIQGQDSSTAFQQWLNSKSNAHVDVYADRTTITSDLLANYDVIILQSLSQITAYTQQSDYWVYSADEIAAVSDWVQNKGGSIIALTGYFSGNSYEVASTNQLIGFSGLTFNPDEIVEQSDCPANPASNNQQTCYCWGNSIPISSWNTASPIAQNVKEVGAFLGRSINVDPAVNATVVATFNETSGPYAGKNYDIAVSVQVGKGRVFAFGDEWITYNSQWDGTSLSEPASAYANQYDPCYNQSPTQVFQIPQFWYNTLKWCAPLVDCKLTIDNPYIVMVN
jgi:hypothetical protein